uniref:NADH-ubiquinone oxidoreductase chain 2 n=1 Tax=Staphylinidae sp. BMNH 1274240 TaxID=1796567 RepID=A0A126TEN7_9COLE|nr:NADH dehydrogenase subunit 2 [Staphylinidae sp. BMNH 1274240]
MLFFLIYKILFLSSMFIGTIISISSNTWLGMWIGLEINLLSIIPLMNNKKMAPSSEAALKYFITQAVASSILLFSIIFMSIIIFNNKTYDNLMTLIFNSALLTKMGMAPFHFWMPEVMEGLTWMNCLIVLTISKFAPMILLTYNITYNFFFIIIILLGMMISGIMGLNQISLRKIMAFSSINHMSWMITAMFFMNSIFLWYFLMYTFLSISIIWMFNYLNIFYIKELIYSINKTFMFKFLFIFNFMSLGGLPPFIGFMPKWLTIQFLMYENNIMISFLMILLTLLTLFYYLRIIYSSLTLSTKKLSYTFYSIPNNFINMSLSMFNISGLMICVSLCNFT